MTLYIVTRPALNAADSKPPLSINGVEIAYNLNTPCKLDDDAAEALRNTFGFTVAPVGSDEQDDTAPEPELTPEPPLDPDTTSPASGESDGAASPDGGAADGSADSTSDFDPEAVITGTVAEVTAKLAGLTPEQLAAVQAAETDREQPRKGVTKAIADAIAATQE